MSKEKKSEIRCQKHGEVKTGVTEKDYGIEDGKELRICGLCWLDYLKKHCYVNKELKDV